MCGFLVTVGASKAFTHRDLAPMKKRGPDGIGFWTDGPVAMAQTRLAVVGLDDRALAPVENFRHVLVFNGEIYNFLALARRLGVRASSDTQVLLEAWTARGADILPELEGFWSFAVYDKLAKTVTLCRDQYGVKPLYYTTLQNGLVASSTLAPLLASLERKPSLNFGAMSEWARYQLTTRQTTFLHGVHKISPGETYAYDVESRQRTAIRVYERIWHGQGSERATDGWVDDARQLLRDCVDEAGAADLPVTSTCSGGLDSSLLTALLRPRFAYHGAFSDPDCNEVGWAKRAIDGTATALVVEPCRVDFDLVDRLEDLVEDFDGFSVGSAILPLDDLFGCVSRDYRVCLLGTGGDELFGGYARYAMALGECPQESYRDAFDKLGPLATSSTWQRFEACHVKGDTSLFKFYDPGVRASFMSDHVGSGLGAMLAFDRKYFLAGLLNIDDRMAGRHGLEGRPALLHQRFVRKVLELHPSQAGGKKVLRRIARGILPDAVVDRQDKLGFTVPIGTIANANTARIRESLAGSRFRDLYDLRGVVSGAETKYSRRLFGLALLDAWLRRYA